VGLQPVRQWPGLAAGQHVGRVPGGGVDQDGRVNVPAAQREVINTRHLRRSSDRRPGQVEHRPQQRAAVHRDPERPGQPRPGPPGQLQRDLRQ
jgi:hypothetical protein